jgi:hypothetical protein
MTQSAPWAHLWRRSVLAGSLPTHLNWNKLFYCVTLYCPNRVLGILLQRVPVRPRPFQVTRLQQQVGSICDAPAPIATGTCFVQVYFVSGTTGWGSRNNKPSLPSGLAKFVLVRSLAVNYNITRSVRI